MVEQDSKKPFWQRKTLADMSDREWESLCDGCGRCCLNKVEYVETGDIGVSDVACKLLDLESCKCSQYKNRKKHVPDCIKLEWSHIGRLHWLPETCAYRLLYEGKALKEWHPLISGRASSVHEAGISVKGKAVSEAPHIKIERRIKKWIAGR
ncbi:MAG: YcgN family cysteine cluster protein [Pseudomonadota bacterium]